MGRVGIVVNFTALDDWDVRVHKSHQAAQDARFSLAAQAQQNEMMARQNGVDDLRKDGIVVAVHAGKELVALFQFVQEIFAQFLAHATLRDFLFGPLTAAKLTERFRQ